MAKFTQQEKKAYFESLRLEWKKSKALAEADMKAEALFREAGLKGISYYGFYFVLKQMQKLKFKGLPYVDCKTFQGWIDNGYKVTKGEKSKIRGVTWIGVKADNTKADKDKDSPEDIAFLYPKVYRLFHKSQVTECE